MDNKDLEIVNKAQEEAKELSKDTETGLSEEVPADAPEKNIGGKKPKKKRRALKVLLIILAVILALVLILFGACSILKETGKAKFKPAIMSPDSITQVDGAIAYDEGKTVNYNGKVYEYNEDVIYVAFMGVDKDNLEMGEDFEEGSGQCDTNMIVAIDTKSGKMSLIIIPRDSMVNVNVLGPDGNLVNVSEMQLCLAYAYGDGKKTSCENQIISMERLLCGIKIDNYYSLDLKGIGGLNDAVGGINLTAIETIRGVCTEGQPVTLWGMNAQKYVQVRDIMTFNSDSLRRKRQIQYAKAFIAKAFSEIKSDFTKVTDLYNVASQYSYTNFDLSHVTYLASVLVEKHNAFTINDEDIHVLEGTVDRPGKYMEVHLDQTKVLETILEVFYKEK